MEKTGKKYKSMHKIIYYPLILLLLLISALATNGQEVPDSFETGFNRHKTYGNWSSVDFGGHEYFYYIKNNALNIEANKHSWHFLQLWLNTLNIQENPFIVFDLKTSKPVLVTVSMNDTVNKKINITQRASASNSYNTFVFNFTESIGDIDPVIQEVRFALNDNSDFKGMLVMDNLKIGNAVKFPMLSISPNSVLVLHEKGEITVTVENLLKDFPMYWNATLVDKNNDWLWLLNKNAAPSDTVKGIDDGSFKVGYNENNGNGLGQGGIR